MKLSSNAYADKDTIPPRHARRGVTGGANVSPPLTWEGAPNNVKSYALVMIDVSARNWVHWMVIDIPSGVTSLNEGASGVGMPAGSRELATTFGSIGYGGPEPPRGSGPHDYVTTLYALNTTKLSLSERASYEDFLHAVEGKVLAKASLFGTFER